MSDFIIINGMDRSGSSAISRTLASHPQAELIMQPFNSGFLRRRMYEVLDECDVQNEAHQFFNDLSRNKLNEQLIASQWHYKYSTTRKYIPGKIHIIKTTLNHFAQRWMKKYHPDIDIWGIWRDPFDIVASIIGNGFYGDWYKEALQQITPVVKDEPILRGNYLNFFSKVTSDSEEVALLLAVRTHFFLEYLDHDKLLIYENFRTNANKALKIFTEQYGMGEFDFTKASKQDLNLVGKAFNSAKPNNFISEGNYELKKEIFQPLMKLYRQKFSIND